MRIFLPFVRLPAITSLPLRANDFFNAYLRNEKTQSIGSMRDRIK
jgi:hypothetical protein